MRTRHEQRRAKRSVEKSVKKEEGGGKKRSRRPGLNELRIDKDGHSEVSAKKMQPDGDGRALLDECF